jgi:hypothetical protein
MIIKIKIKVKATLKKILNYKIVQKLVINERCSAQHGIIVLQYVEQTKGVDPSGRVA